MDTKLFSILNNTGIKYKLETSVDGIGIRIMTEWIVIQTLPYQHQ